MSQILVSCEMPIQWEQFCLVFIANTCSILYFIQFVLIVIFMTLHIPDHVPPVCVPEHCGVHKHNI